MEGILLIILLVVCIGVVFILADQEWEYKDEIDKLRQKEEDDEEEDEEDEEEDDDKR